MVSLKRWLSLCTLRFLLPLWFGVAESGNKLLYHAHLPLQSQKSCCASLRQNSWVGQPPCKLLLQSYCWQTFWSNSSLIKGKEKVGAIVSMLSNYLMLYSSWGHNKSAIVAEHKAFARQQYSVVCLLKQLHLTFQLVSHMFGFCTCML